MSGADFFGLVVCRRSCSRGPPLRACSAGRSLTDDRSPAGLTIVIFAVVLTALAIRSAATWRACTAASGCSSIAAACAAPSAFLYRVMRVDPEHGQDWKAYAKSLIIFSLAGWLLLYFILRTQPLWDFTGLNPMGFHSAPWNVTFNTVLVVPDEHQLAVLRRRDDDELLQPDGRADGPELPLGRRRHRRRGRADPRDHRPQRQEPRQLLAGPHPHGPVRAACRSRSSPRSCSSPRA